MGIYHAKLILGSYRADQANDPEIYVTAIAHLLSRYPTDIGARLTDPKDGVAGKYKFLPTVSEVRGEAEKLIKEEGDRAYRQSELQKQWELRAEVESQDKAEPPEYRQKVAQRIRGEIKEAFASGEHEPFNVFVPMFAPQYAEMVKRGGLPGFSLEDKKRAGIWVRLSWLQGQRTQVGQWRQFTSEELVAKYAQKPTNG